MSPIEQLNRDLFLQINGGANSPVWLVRVAIATADYLIWLIPSLLLGLWLLGGQARRSVALKACAVALLGVVANQAIGVIWPHPRPFVLGLGHTWIPHAPDSSFPSDHLVVIAGVGLTLLLDGMPGLGVVVLLAGAAIAWARVFVGVHFPLDMVGALLVAAAVYLAMTPLWRSIGQPVTTAVERPYLRASNWLLAVGRKNKA